MDVAMITAQLSCAKRLQVGAVAVLDKRIICVGFNGMPEDSKDNNCECVVDGVLVTRPEVIHAEHNLIKFANSHDIDIFGATMYITHAPCIGCASRIAAAGFDKVIWKDDYRSIDGIKFLQSNNIETYCMEHICQN
jgi:dCMP deaminase